MKTSPRSSWLAVMAATLFGFGLLFAPREQTGRIETLVHDASLPGLRVLNRSQSWAKSLPQSLGELAALADAQIAAGQSSASTSETDETRREIAALQQDLRKLQSQNAQLLSELEQARTRSGSPFIAETPAPLFVPELLNATIVAVDDVSVAVQRASAQRIVDVGQTNGVVPADFVVSADSISAASPQLLIDQGGDAGLHSDQPVFAGRCVVGKIQQVGRWTSSVLPLTDAEFRGRAQLMRRTADGLVVGSEGILAGDGQDACQLNFIAATEPVAVGDEVYTAATGTPLPVPMYYGRVTSVHLETGAPYWSIVVKPSATMDKAQSVQVLRTVLNPVRTTPQPPGELP